MSDSNIDQMLNKSIAAYKKDDITTASKLLAQVIKQDPNNERAWLWLSGIVSSDAERLFCIKRLLAINPENEIAKHGLTLLPQNLGSQTFYSLLSTFLSEGCWHLQHGQAISTSRPFCCGSEQGYF